MDIGGLNRRISIESIAETVNEAGLTEQISGTSFTTWAKIEAARNRQYYEAQKIKDANAYKITIRYRAGISSHMIVKYQDHIFEIQTPVDPEMKHEFLELYCIERLRGDGHE